MAEFLYIEKALPWNLYMACDRDKSWIHADHASILKKEVENKVIRQEKSWLLTLTKDLEMITTNTNHHRNRDKVSSHHHQKETMFDQL